MVSERIFGLDLIRTIAAIVIVFLHSHYLIAPHFDLPSGIHFPDGVDVFFVLSGFLIGRIFLNTFSAPEDFSWKNVLHFLKRRWYRTLPNYYLFLILNIILIYFTLIPGRLNENTAYYFIFMQNFVVPLDLMFWESWSLTIEEWFYPIFPITMFLLYHVFKSKITPKRGYLFVALGMIILPLIYRLLTYSADLDWDLYFRKLVLTRLDALGFGLLAAYFQIFHFKQFFKSRYILFPLGIVLYIFLENLFADSSHFFHSTFFFSMTALGVAFLFPLMYEMKVERIPRKPIRFLSLISYSIYLSHLPIAYLTHSWYEGSTATETIFLYASYWAMVILTSYLIYTFFERPITNLRDRIK